MRRLSKILLAVAMTGFVTSSCHTTARMCRTNPSQSDLAFDSLAASWDEGMPLGNAVVGELVWRKGNALRLSLDRTDLWDLRPVDSLSGDNYSFKWVREHIVNLKSASNLNGNLNCSKELEHYAS